MKRIKRERSTPKGVISRLYTSSNIIQLVTVLIKSVRTQLAIATSASKAEINIIRLVTVLINSMDRLQKPYVLTQLAIATAKNNERSYTNSASKVKINIIQLVTELINECRRKQLYVSTQLAIAAAAATTTVLSLRNTGSVLLAHPQQPYKRTQLAIVTRLQKPYVHIPLAIATAI